MAFKKQYKTRTGINLPASYWRVSAVTGNKDRATASVEVFADSDAAANGLPCLERYPFDFIPSGDDRWDAQAYKFLKLLPEFQEAEDC